MRKDRKKLVGRSGIYLGTAALAFFIGFGTPLSALADFGPGMSKEEWAELAPEENPGEGSLGEENPGGENLGEGIRGEENLLEENLLEENGNVPEPAADDAQTASFSVNQFRLPENAAVLAVVEGTGGSSCQVYAYEKNGQGQWELRFETSGYLGRNGMSANRISGDKTTPVGLFELNTPFGQKEALEGFPENYIQVDEHYLWSDEKNRLVTGETGEGEWVGTAGYADYYDYCLDMGYNRNALPKKGSALFIHCHGGGRTETSGCVSIEKERMIDLLRLYGTYGDGRCFIALAPEGGFEAVYDSLGSNQGLSPQGAL